LERQEQVPADGDAGRSRGSDVTPDPVEAGRARGRDARRDLPEPERVREQLEAAQRLARIGSWYANRRTGELTWSPTIFEIFGLDPASFEPSHDAFLAAVHPDDRAAVQRSVEASRSSGLYDVVHRIVRPDGTIRTVHELAESHLDEHGALVSLTGTVQDVTELWAAKDAAEASEERLERVLAATQDGWWESDLVAGVTYHSPRWWEIHGLEHGALPASPDLWRTLTHPDDVELVERLLERAMATRTPRHTFTTRIVHADGHLVPVSVRMLIQFDDDGRPIRISGTATDITELVRAQQMQDEFVSTVSHELRTPLTAIGGALELLARTLPAELDGRSRELLAMAERNTDRLRRLIDDLLDAEQLARPQDFAVDHVRLVEVITEVLADHAPFAATRQVTFACTQQLTDVVVAADRGRLEQVLVNYLSNAVKFAPAGSVVEVAMSRGPGRVRTEVIDRGPGVPADFAERAFTRFAQADPTDHRSRGGTGLGLAITRELVEAFGGEVGYDSVPGRTSFWFDLPEAGS
jgi:PAS domain S-box-containing protein